MFSTAEDWMFSTAKDLVGAHNFAKELMFTTMDAKDLMFTPYMPKT